MCVCFLIYLFLIEGWLLYNIGLISAIHQHELAILCLTQSDPLDCSLPGSSIHGIDSPGKSTGVGSHALLQGIFPTQGWNLGLQHCKQVLYHLSHLGSPNQPEVYICPLLLDPPSHLPPLFHPSRLLQSPSLSSLSHSANFHWPSILHMVVYRRSMLLCPSISPSPPPPTPHLRP